MICSAVCLFLLISLVPFCDYHFPKIRNGSLFGGQVKLIGYILANYQELKPVQETSNPTSGKAVLSVSDIAQYLGVSESIVRGKIKRNEIPYVRIDGQYKFYLPVVEEWLKQKSVHPLEASAAEMEHQEADDSFANEQTTKIWNKTKGVK
jgi:excisionase family DNA binding protein